MLNRCPDCGSNNRSHREYCGRCGAKLTRSHRSLHLANQGRGSHFIFDHKVN